MNLKKFTAGTPRDALRMVREALGPEAVILSNRSVNGFIEIIALAENEMQSIIAPAEKPAPSAAAGSGARSDEDEQEEESGLAAFARRRDAQAAVSQMAAKPLATTQEAATPASQAGSYAAVNSRQPILSPLRAEPAAMPNRAFDTGLASQLSQPAYRSQPSQPSQPAPAPVSVLADVMDEIRSMRGMLESQLTELAWANQQKREPVKATIMREMLSAGFSASLSRYLTEHAPAAAGQDGMRWMKTILLRNLQAQANENEILDRGGVFALVGPTGVGKTTTTAKLAARCVMHHGASKLALITTDGYRIGGYEQLRIYGKILGVIVHSVKDEADLRIALAELKNKHTVLIDTAGVGQRDQMVAEQVAMLQAADQPVKRLLCLPATSTGETLNEVVRAYRGNGLAGCILTKLDEAATIGNVLDVIIRQKLSLYYVANGQRVPEDLHLARPQYLIDRAFKLKRESAPFQFLDEELPAIVASAQSARNDISLREVSLG